MTRRGRGSSSDGCVTLTLNKYAQTGRAALLGESRSEAVWLPLSLISMSNLDVPEHDDFIEDVVVDVLEWKAIEEGLV